MQETNSQKECECCAHPTLSLEDYNARSKPRLEAIDRLAARINFSDMRWKNTPEGERYERLMREQAKDEAAAGL